jgi:hypothetical protein
MSAKELRERANTCLQLSTTVTAQADQQTLQDLAHEYLAEADQIEAASPRSSDGRLRSLLGAAENNHKTGQSMTGRLPKIGAQFVC